MSETVYNIGIFLLILNIVLPVFTYSLMDISEDQNPLNEVRSLDLDSLIESGIYLEKDERHNITFGNIAEFNISRPVRVWWRDLAISTDYFWIYTNRFNIEYGGNWPFKDTVVSYINGELYNLINQITNQTIINEYDYDYNWTRVSLSEIGHELFFTCEKYGNNITLAVNSGELNITLGKPVEFEDFGAGEFVNWYWGLLSGQDSYDLPLVLAWIFRIQTVLLIVSAVIIGRDLLPIP